MYVGFECRVVTDDDRTRADAGRYDSEFDDEDFLVALDELELPTSGDVADVVGCSRPTARRRLQQLEEDGEVESKEIGGYQVWSLNVD